MEISQSRIQELIQNPTEGLNVEVKRWLNPSDIPGKCKFIQASLALRNRNGGFLIIGFDDKTHAPDLGNELIDPTASFHLDVIQALVAKYASTIFEIGIGFGKRDGILYPVIEVPPGVKTPVFAKSDLFDASGQNRLIRVGDFWVRTLQANGTPSTARATPQDWAEVIEICFENREADIGRFLRRHLSGGELARLPIALRDAGLLSPVAPSASLKDRAFKLLGDGCSAFLRAVGERTLISGGQKIREYGSWSLALVIDPAREGVLPNEQFLNVIGASNPRYSGWPVWLDSRGFVDRSAVPKVIDGAWEALIVSSRLDWVNIDFMRLNPIGEFYLWRVLEDDVSPSVTPSSSLDPILVLLRVSEAIAVGLTLATALAWPAESTTLGFAFRWSKLRARELRPWANRMVTFTEGRVAHDDEATTYVEIPLNTPVSAIPPLVQQATNGLFVLFDGFTMPASSTEHWVQRLLERKF